MAGAIKCTAINGLYERRQTTRRAPQCREAVLSRIQHRFVQLPPTHLLLKGLVVETGCRGARGRKGKESQNHLQTKNDRLGLPDNCTNPNLDHALVGNRTIMECDRTCFECFLAD